MNQRTLWEKNVRFNNGKFRFIATVTLTSKTRDYVGQKDVYLRTVPKVYKTLSFVGDYRQLALMGGESCGQNYGELLENFPESEEAKTLVTFWKDLHLNGLNSGTARQDKYLAGGYPKKGETYNYEGACEYLKAHDLYVDRGYKYGEKWLLRVIPDSTISKLSQFLDSMRND